MRTLLKTLLLLTILITVPHASDFTYKLLDEEVIAKGLELRENLIHNGSRSIKVFPEINAIDDKQLKEYKSWCEKQQKPVGNLFKYEGICTMDKIGLVAGPILEKWQSDLYSQFNGILSLKRRWVRNPKYTHGGDEPYSIYSDEYIKTKEIYIKQFQKLYLEGFKIAVDIFNTQQEDPELAEYIFKQLTNHEDCISYSLYTISEKEWENIGNLYMGIEFKINGPKSTNGELTKITDLPPIPEILQIVETLKIPEPFKSKCLAAVQ
jgi:hypothetical protein